MNALSRPASPPTSELATTRALVVSKNTHTMSSPFQEHLSTNHSPSAMDSQGIHQWTGSASQKLSAIDAQLSHLQQQMAKLQADRSALCNDMLIPQIARRLPQDVLQEIFIACLPTDHNPAMSVLEAPMLLTQICSLWRQVAFATPQVWTQIHIVLPITIVSDAEGKSQEDEARVVSKLHARERGVNEWLARSGTCPLSISIHETFSSYPYPKDELLKTCDLMHMSFIGETIAKYSERWYSVELNVFTKLYEYIMTFVGQKGLPSLRHFHMIETQPSFANHEMNLTEWLDTDVLRSLNLKSLTIGWDRILPVDTSFVKSFTELTELNLHGENMHESIVLLPGIIEAALRECKALHTFRVSVVDLAAEWPDTITLSNLTTFSLTSNINVTGDNIAALLKFLHLPDLNNLELHICPMMLDEDTREEGIEPLRVALNDFFAINAKCLTGLILFPGREVGPCVLELLKHTPRLRHLSFGSNQYFTKFQRPMLRVIAVHIHINDDFIKALTPSIDTPSEEIICPYLETFEAIEDIRTGISEESLSDFINSRRDPVHWAGSSLKRVIVSVNYSSKDRKGYRRWSDGLEGGILYMRAPARGRFTPFGGLPLSLEEMAVESSLDYYDFSRS